MRKTFITLLAASVALVACQKETELKPVSLGESVKLTIVAAQDEATKTVLNGTEAKWSATDKVTVMYKKDGESTWSTAESSPAASTDEYATATFEATLTTPDAGENAYAIYPANNLSQTVADKAKITIASTQHPTGTGFDGGSDIMISKPFLPSAVPVSTQFARANAVLKIKINNPTLATEKLVSLSVEGDDDLVGDVLVGLSDHAVKGIDNGSHTVTAEYATANQFELGADGKFVYLIVKPQTLSSGSHLVINGVTRNYTFTKDITLPNDIHLSAGHIMPLNINITSTTLTSSIDVLTNSWTGIGTSQKGYTDWTNKAGSSSSAKYAGNSYDNSSNLIQLRATTNSGIVSTSTGGAVKRVKVVYGGSNTNNRTITVYGKNTAYTGPSDLYDDETKGTVLGTIKFTTGASSSYLDIDGYYEHLGLWSGDGTMYFSEIDIYWGAAKTPTGLVWKKTGEKATTDTAEMLTGDDTMPTIALDNPNGLSVSYASSVPSVATINSSTGAIVLVGAGSTVISASYEGDETYKSDVQSYTLTVTDSRTTPAITLDESDENRTTSNYSGFTGRSATVDPSVTLTYSKSDPSSIIAEFNTSTGALTLNGTSGSATVTVSFAGNTEYKAAESKSYTIYVTDPSKSLSSITITKAPTKVNYLTTETTMSLAGATITATYSDASESNVTAYCTITNASTILASAGTGKSATVSYTEGGVTKTANYSVNVYNPSATYTTGIGGASASVSSGGTDYKVKISTVDYNAVKANKDATFTITVPSGSTKVHLFIAAWNGESCNVTVTGGTMSSNSITADSGISGSGKTYTLAGTISNYYKTINLTNNTTTEVTIDLPSNKRAVIWGINAQ